MKETYEEMKERHQQEWNNQNIMWAFNEEQFKIGMETNFGLTEHDTDKILSIGGGGYILKTDKTKLEQLTQNQRNEIKNFKLNNKSINEIKEMFLNEMLNHEFGYTGDIDETLKSLQITQEELDNNKRLKKGLQLALKYFN